MITGLWHSLINSWGGENRRRWRRHSRVTYVEIQPLDADLVLSGAPAWGMTRDFSRHGIGFTTPFELKCIYVKITVREDRSTHVGIVRHQRKISSEAEGSLYFVGVELVDETGIVAWH